MNDQEWERQWWGTCANTFWEETKQMLYAQKMGLIPENAGGCYPVYDMGGKSVIDIGGGPVSMLLKCQNVGDPTVVDPCDYPEWVDSRYHQVGIYWMHEEAETFNSARIWDEAWIYNCLQHVIDPQQIVKNTKRHARTIRIFEWIDCGTSEGHPHELHAHELDEWLGGTGYTEDLATAGCYGKAYYGVFK